MKWTVLLLIVHLFTSCTTESGTTLQVEYAGALKNMMKKGDISTKISLDTLSDKQHLYALGAISELKGEIQVFNGQPLISYTQNGTIKIDTTFHIDATLLVYSRIKEWIEISIDDNIKNMDQLEKYVEGEAIKAGINTDKPFPFLIHGNMESINWHIINWKEGDTEHTHEKHISSGPLGKLQDVNVKILGFYSEHHKGIFTHHTSRMHLHTYVSNHNIAGHVDDVTLGNDCILSLPFIKSSNE